MMENEVAELRSQVNALKIENSEREKILSLRGQDKVYGSPSLKSPSPPSSPLDEPVTPSDMQKTIERIRREATKDIQKLWET